MKKGRDKVAHIVICFFGTVLFSLVLPVWQAALGFFLFFTITKEVINDLILKRGTFSWWDIVANAVGCELAWVALWIFQRGSGQ